MSSSLSPERATAPRLRALVVEDEWPARNYLVEILQRSGMVELLAAVASAADATEALRTNAVDVAFVDIHLAGDPSGGLGLIRSLAAQAKAPRLVITTALKQHAIEAFALGVCDYLLKPFSEERVHLCLARLRESAISTSGSTSGAGDAAAAPARVAARSKRGIVFFTRDEIWAFEAAERLTFVHTDKGRYDIDLSLATLATLFGDATTTAPDAGFTRVHRNWLVSVARIRAIEREDGDTELLVGDATADHAALRVPVARERAHAVRELLLAGAAGLRRTSP